MDWLSNIFLGTSYQLGEEAMLLQSRFANAKAREAATIANAVEPRAESAYYDQSSDSEALLRSADRIIINLKSGATFSFPSALAQGLAGASPEDLAEVEVTPSGDGLHWEKLDADFSVPALLAGVFGTAAWMAQLKMKAS
ncbi:MAG: DUF2442 domain-containing protein [Cyanobacteriota bacterium]